MFKLVVYYVALQFQITYLPYETLEHCVAAGREMAEVIKADNTAQEQHVSIACYRMQFDELQQPKSLKM